MDALATVVNNYSSDNRGGGNWKNINNNKNNNNKIIIDKSSYNKKNYKNNDNKNNKIIDNNDSNKFINNNNNNINNCNNKNYNCNLRPSAVTTSSITTTATTKATTTPKSSTASFYEASTEGSTTETVTTTRTTRTKTATSTATTTSDKSATTVIPPTTTTTTRNIPPSLTTTTKSLSTMGILLNSPLMKATATAATIITTTAATTSADTARTNMSMTAAATVVTGLLPAFVALVEGNEMAATTTTPTTATMSTTTTTTTTSYDLMWNASDWFAATTTPLIAGGSPDVDTALVHGLGSMATSTAGNFDDVGGMSLNDSEELNEAATEYIFDRTDVRVVFITLYTLVFCCCFFGNLLVILVVTLSRRLRSITNFFLANLALADFCVGLFCVMQNLSIYLIDSWVFGEFLCRMYQFVHSLSYTASIFILVVICMERYFAIVHPITCKQILTAARLRMVILTVWITSAVYSTPKFVFSKTIKNIHTEDGQEEEICVLDRKMYNSKLLDMINFVLLYAIPLLVMTVLYSKIAIALWRSSRGLSHHIASQQQENNGMGLHNSMYHHHANHHHPQHPHQHHPQQHHHHHQSLSHQLQEPSTPILGLSGHSLLSRKQSSKYEKRGVSISESQVSLESDRPIVSACRGVGVSGSIKGSFYHHSHAHPHGHNSQPQQQQQQLQHQQLHQPRHGGSRGGASHMSHSSSNVLRARRGVVRMLIIFVLTFALCNLPYHARKMWQYWSRSYRGDSNFNALLTPLTFLVTYFNSGVNPLLYAFLSRNFRKGMKELLLCSWKKGKGKSSSNSSMHHKRMALQTHSLPTDTTHIGNDQL